MCAIEVRGHGELAKAVTISRYTDIPIMPVIHEGIRVRIVILVFELTIPRIALF